MNTGALIRTSPTFDGTAGSTSSQPNPELGLVIKTAAAKALLKAAPSASNIQVTLKSTLDGVDPTSERAIYDHFGFVEVSAKATTCAGSVIELSGEFDTNAGKLITVDIKR